MKIILSLPNEDFTKEYDVKEIILEKNLILVHDKDMSTLNFMNKGHFTATIGKEQESKLILNFVNSSRFDDNSRSTCFQII